MKSNLHVPNEIKIASLESYLKAFNAKVWQDTKSMFWKVLMLYLIAKYALVDVLVQAPGLSFIAKFSIIFFIIMEILAMLAVVGHNYIVRKQIDLIKRSEETE